MSEINFFNMDLVTESDIRIDDTQILKDANETSKIPSRFWNAKFSDFADIVTKDNQGNVAYNVTADVKEFALSKSSGKVLGLFGPNGVGKTYTVCAASHERAVEGKHPGLYLSCRLLKPMIMTSRSFKATESEMDLYEKYSKTPFLILDEVGKCTDPDIEWDFVTTLFALRYDNNLDTIFTTNMDVQMFKDFILNTNNKGQDVYDRLHSSLATRVVRGESHR